MRRTIVALALVLGMTVGVSGQGSSALASSTAPVVAEALTWSAPAFLRTIGARGSAGLYAWGVGFNPVTNEVLVGDYLNYQVRRFTTGGSLLGSFYRSAADRRGQPEGIAIDPRDGSVYVSDHSRDNRGYVAKFTKSGAFVREYKLSATYHAWMAVDREGYLYVSDSHTWHNESNPPQVRKYRMEDSAAVEVDRWGTYGTAPGQIRQVTGLTVDPDSGRVFVGDTVNKRLNVYNANGSFHATYGADKFAGDVRGVALNARTRTLYVVDANAGQVERFNLDTGAHLGTFGRLGTGAGEFGDGGRQIAVDGAGNVWVADYGNTRVLKFTGTGTFIGAYPDPPQDAPAGALGLVRDIAVKASNQALYTIEQNNHRIQRFRPDGTPNGMWGRRSTEGALAFNYPRAIAVQPGSERIWISNTTGSSVKVLTPNMGLAFSVGGFNEPIDIEFGNGNVYVADADARNVKILNPSDGARVGVIDVAAAGVAIDAATGHLYLSSWYTDTIYHFQANGSPATPATFGGPGTGQGQLLNPWDIEVLDGRVYVTDSERAKVVVYTTNGDFLGEFGSAGSRAGEFQNPSGLTVDAAGRVYVADAGNDRIQVFDPRTKLAPDSTAPTVSLTNPRESSLPAPATLTGSTSDNLRVGTVEVAIQDKATKLWWDGRISTWARTKSWTNAGLKGGNYKTMQWWFPFIGVQARANYLVQVRAWDANKNMGNTVTSSFSISG